MGIVSNNEQQEVQQSSSLYDRIQYQQQLYTDTYTIMLAQRSDASLPMYTSKEQQLLHMKLVAASWGALAAATTVRGRSSDARSSSSTTIITKAIETRNVVERLRLGVMMLDSQVPSGREENGVVIVEGLKVEYISINYCKVHTPPTT